MKARITMDVEWTNPDAITRDDMVDLGSDIAR